MTYCVRLSLIGSMKDQTGLGREIGGSVDACKEHVRFRRARWNLLWFDWTSGSLCYLCFLCRKLFFFFPRDVCIHAFFFFFSPMTCPTSLNKRQGQSASYKTLNNLAFPRTLACSWSNLQFKGNTLSSLNGGWKTGTHCSDICGEEDCNGSKIIMRCFLLNGDLLRDE